MKGPPQKQYKSPCYYDQNPTLNIFNICNPNIKLKSMLKYDYVSPMYAGL